MGNNCKEGIRRGVPLGSLLPESIDVAAGLVFVYLFMSVLATIGREALEAFLRTRALHLEQGLIELLCVRTPVGKSKTKTAVDYQMLQNFFEHPLIMSLYRGQYTIPPKRKPLSGLTLPSYIPSGHFAYAVLDLLAEAGGQTSAGNLDLNDIVAGANAIDNKKLGKMAQFAVNNAGGDLDKARSFIESWFNATMDRVSGIYRRETQTILFWISLVFCVLLNVNTVVIADNLYRSPSLRKTLEAQAEAYYNSKPSAIDTLTTQPASSFTDSSSAASATDAAAVAPAETKVATAESKTTSEKTSGEKTSSEKTSSEKTGPAVAQTAVSQTQGNSKVPSAETPPPDKLDKAPPAATLVTGRDIPGLLSKTDPLEKLGLPIGWNTQTITAMHRLFPDAPMVSTAEAQNMQTLGSMNIKATNPFQWISLCFGRIGQIWHDTMKAYQDNGQDPTKNALFNVAGAIALICGWLMTAFAVTLGAPFWFDVLGKLMVVRSTMKPGEKGSSDLNGLSAIAAALLSPDGSSSSSAAPAATSYTPSFSAAAAGPSSGDDLSTIDPNSRPRDP